MTSHFKHVVGMFLYAEFPEHSWMSMTLNQNSIGFEFFTATQIPLWNVQSYLFLLSDDAMFSNFALKEYIK